MFYSDLSPRHDFYENTISYIKRLLIRICKKTVKNKSNRLFNNKPLLKLDRDDLKNLQIN